MNPTPLDIIDEPAYLRFCALIRSRYSTCSPIDAIASAVSDLLTFGEAAYARADLHTVGVLHYCFSRLSQNWDAYVAHISRTAHHGEPLTTIRTTEAAGAAR